LLFFFGAQRRHTLSIDWLAAGAANAGRILDGRWGALKSLPKGVQLLEPLAQRLVELTSERRREADADLEPLETDPELLPAARAHALDIKFEVVVRSGRGEPRHHLTMARKTLPWAGGRKPRRDAV
jgi:hypothetical protein